MTTQSAHAPITITRSARGVRVQASGHAALAILDELANGAPTFEAAAFAAWVKGFPRASSMQPDTTLEAAA
ncbi:hypothetical protein CIG66_17060 [Ralstonia pseudosolanacearum]|uniref:hypothetical protein n=1 Tax=Ralstonia pseudosolanacearum TaxID=1310165 RepID=UPI000B9A189E|nr:hypothetical protein CIG66_17060 [Ralstonia pseudosolanacearum]